MESTATKTKTKAIAYGNNHSFTSLGPMEIERRQPGAKDVAVDILYAGVCHSDLHQASNDWGNTVYPCIPGHEIVGRVTATGAKDFFLSTDTSAMDALELQFDFLLNTIPYPFDPNPYVKLLKRDATMAVVGLLLPFSAPTNNQEIIMHRRRLAGSLVGGVPETQELLDFCGEHNILPEVEMIAMADINDAHKRMKDEEVHFRYVVDINGTMPKEA